MKIAYLHNLPLEYYPPATITLDLLGAARGAEVRAYSCGNLKNRSPYGNGAVTTVRYPSPDPGAGPLVRLAVALGWHLRTAASLLRFRPDALIYVEPHSALAAWLYLRLAGGKARLFVHHHEYYDPHDYLRPGMRLPRLGAELEGLFLFRRACWISQTNEDRLAMMKSRYPEIPAGVWRLLPNYPPAAWGRGGRPAEPRGNGPLRLVYVGSASFRDTYVREIVLWAAANPGKVRLHLCGYNVSPEVWGWLEGERFANVTFDAGGYAYDDLPRILSGFDVGLVLYKGNTTNFIYNVPNKVFEYLACGLEVWYPLEMAGMRRCRDQNPAWVRELDFAGLSALRPEELQRGGPAQPPAGYSAEDALAPLVAGLGLQP